MKEFLGIAKRGPLVTLQQDGHESGDNDTCIEITRNYRGQIHLEIISAITYYLSLPITNSYCPISCQSRVVRDTPLPLSCDKPVASSAPCAFSSMVFHGEIKRLQGEAPPGKPSVIVLKSPF